MADIEPIGLSLDTSGVEKGIKSLDTLAQQGPKVEKAMDRVEGAAKKTAKSLKDLGSDAEKGIGDAAAKTPKLAENLEKVSRSADDAQKALRAIVTSSAQMQKMVDAAKSAALNMSSFGSAVSAGLGGMESLRGSVNAANLALSSYTQLLSQSVPSLNAVSASQQAAAKNALEFAAASRLATEQMRGFASLAQQMSASANVHAAASKDSTSAAKSAAAALNEQKNAAAGANESMSRLATVGIQAFVVSQLVRYTLDAAKAMYEASAQAQRLQTTLNYATGGNGAQEMEQVRRTANSLGLAFNDTAKAYAQFQAAARGTALEGTKAREVFESVAKASAVLGLSASDTSGVLLALQQMISKGTVQSEELRGQLGERLPGAFQSAARAMGVTTAELGKMLEQGQVIADDFLPKFAAQLETDFGGAAEKAADRLDAALNRFNNAWEKTKQTLGDSGINEASKAFLNAATNDMDAFTEAMARARTEGDGAFGQLVQGLSALGGRALNLQMVSDGFRSNAEQADAFAKKLKDAERELAELDARGAQTSGNLMLRQMYQDAVRTRDALREAKIARDALANSGGQATPGADDENFGIGAAAWQQTQEKMKASEKEVQQIMMKSAGITKEYQESLSKLQNAKQLGVLSDKAYAEAVTDLAKRTWDASTAGKEDAKAKREAASASKSAESAVRKEMTAYNNLINSIKMKIAQTDEEVKYGRKLTDSERLRYMLTETNSKKISEAHKAEALRLLDVLEASERALKQRQDEADWLKDYLAVKQEIIKAEDEHQRVLKQLNDTLNSLGEKTKAETERLQLEASLIGSTNAQREMELQLYDLKIEKEKKLKEIRSTVAVDEGQAERIAETEAIYAQRAANVAGKAYLDEWQKTVDQVENWFTDSFTRMLTDGKDGWDSFCKSLKNSFLTLVVKEVYKAFAQPFVVNIVGSLVGMTGSGTAQAAGQIASGGSGILGAASNLSSMWNAFSGGMTATLGGAVSSLGSAFGSAALSSFGAGMQGATLAAGLAGPTTAGAGGAMGLGASFGTALPYIGAGLAVISLLGSGMFSTRGANHGGIAYSTSGASTADTARLLTSGLGWKDPEQDFTVRGSTDKQAIKEFKATIDGVKEMYKELGKIARGSVRDIDVAAGFATNSKYNDEESYGYFKIIDKVTGQLLQSYTNRDMSKDGQEAWKQYVADLGKGMLDQLKSADIPSWMDKILGDLGDTPTFEGLQSAVASIVAIDTAFKGWSANIVGFVNTSDQFRQALLDNSGGLNGLASNMEAFYSGFYSEEERYLNARAGVMKQLASLGLEIDPAAGAAAKEQFRAAVEGAMSSGNAELVAQLLAVSGAFAQVADAAGQTRETFADVFESWSNSIAGFAGTSDAFRQSLLSSAGSMDTLQSNMEAFYSGFYSEEEQFMNARAEMQKKLSAMGLEIDPGVGDAAKEQFRQAVENAMAAGNSALVAQLLSLAGSFAQVADAAQQAGGTVNQTAEQMREAALQASGLSVSGLVNGFLGEINAGRGEQAGAWLADTIADGFEQAVYGQALSIVMSAIVDGVITPVVTAALAGTSISEAISEAAIDTMVAKAAAAADALNALLSNDAFRGAMDSILGTVRDLGNSIGASITPQYSAQRAQEEARRAEAERAATQAAQERYNLESRLLQLQGDTATLRARELAQLDPANRALQEQIYALEDAQAAQDAYADSLSKAQSAYESAMSRVQSAQSTVDSIRAQGTQNYIDAQKAVQAAQERIVQIQLDAANEIAKTFLDLGKSLRDWLTTQRSSDTNPQAAFQQMLTKALAGDADAMRGLTTAAQAADEYAKANAASQVQYELERARIQAGVSKAAGVAETKGLGYQAPNPLADAQAALVAANAALAQALSVANAINAPLQQPGDSLITQYTKALQELNNANSSLAQQQAALDSIKSGVWDTSTKTGQVNSSVGAGTTATTNGLGNVYNATGQVKGSTDNVNSSVNALNVLMAQSVDQTRWLSYIYNTLGEISTRTWNVMNNLNYQNNAFDANGYLRVQSMNRGGDPTWFAKGGIVDSMTAFAYGGGLGIMGEAGPEAIMPTQRMANGDLGVRVQMPRMDWSSYGRDPALVAEIRELRAENRAQAAAMVGMQRQLVRLHERWDRNGLPETRSVE